MTRHLPVQLADSVLLLCMLVPFGANLRAQSNEVLGEIELVGATKVEKDVRRIGLMASILAI